MTNFPSGLDDDTTLPFVNDNITEIGGEAINALRDAVFALEQNIGIGAAGTTGSIAARLGVSINPNGTIKPSAIAGLGLVTLPITDDQIADFAQIVESKLKLDHKTQDLYNYIKDLSIGVNTSLGWISTTGVKLDPHLLGAVYRHTLDQIDVSADTNAFLKNKFELLRDNTSAYSLINDINNELLFHQFADGSPVVGTKLIITNDGSTYPSNYAHTASGIWLNTSRFAIIPQTAQDLQSFADFIDNSSILLYGTRIQNFYSNGISRVSRSSSLLIDGYGAPIVPETPAIAYLLNIGNNSSPFDNIDTGDDIIEFKPLSAALSSNTFDEQFALVRVGDIVRINYGTVEVPFVIKEKKYMHGATSGDPKRFLIRIAGKNLVYAPNATARIDRSLVNANKYGVLAIAAAKNFFNETPSLIIGSPRGAQALGLAFNPAAFDQTHYNLYLALYPTGNPLDGYTLMPAVDVTGNQGLTPGEYTLDSIVSTTNDAFRQVGFNYRFIAFSYQGEFGIMLADSYHNSGFSVLNAVVDGNGSLNQPATQLEFPNNVVDVFATDGYTPIDPLGFGPLGAGIASPPFMPSYGSPEAAVQATKIFLPLKRNNYYVNGVEKEKLNLQVDQVLDSFGDGYWFAKVQAQNSFPGAPPTGRVETTYRILFDLSSSGLAIGKTLVVQSLGAGGLLDFGRFTIKNVEFNICAPNIYTDITVYDAVHATGISPLATLPLQSEVAIYFNSDSVSFNRESSTDFSSITPFKRHFEIYVNESGDTFTHERTRINISGSTMTINDSIPLFGGTELVKLNIIKVSPKLRGYQFGSVNKITLRMLSYDDTFGLFDGYLASYDGTTFTHAGPLTAGRKGEITRFYDETYNDYIDILFDVNTSVSSFTDRVVDFQLFPTLSLDDEVMLLATCELNDITNTVAQIRDERQFGNTSEKDLTTSALNFISLPERLLHSNGIIRGFDLSDTLANPNSSQLYLKGGVCLVNGKIIQINDETVTVPPLKELIGATLYDVNWIACVNDRGEYQLIPIVDSDPAISIIPLNPFRMFKAYNVVNGLSYNLDSVTFSFIVSNRKDLTPVYLIRSKVTAGSPPIFNLYVTDVRRFINDVDTNLPLRLTTINSQGNFHNFESILNWIRFNGSFNGNAFVKGANALNATVNDDVTLAFSNNIVFDGENNATVTFNGHVTLGAHVTFKNMTINFNGGVSILNATGDIHFETCVINYMSNLTGPTNAHYSFNFVGCELVTFTDTVINAVYSQPLLNSAVFKVDTTNAFSMHDCLINVTFSATPGVTTPADVFWLNNSPNVNITLTNCFGNFNKYINNINSSGMQVKDGIVQSSYNPSSDFGWSGLDVVNSGSGYIYANITGILDGIVIDNMFFNYAPPSPSDSRFSFINFELSTITSALSDTRITNCRFSDVNTGTTLDGYRAAIAIINVAPRAFPPTFQPILYNVDIADNACNKNQAIIVTSKTFTDGYSFDGYQMLLPGLAAIDVNIEKNICGTIGYWITSGTKIVNIVPNTNAFVDHSVGLNINANICHYIANLTSRGQYFVPSRSWVPVGNTFNTSEYPSGFVTISNNRANWIHVGVAFEEDSSLRILDNSLVAYDTAYLGSGTQISPPPDASQNHRYGDSSYNDVVALGLLFTPNYFNTAIRVLSSMVNIPPYGKDAPVIIRGNTTNPGYFYTTGGALVTYRYDGMLIHCDASNIIKENVLRGFNLTAANYGIAVGGITNNISDNRIYRYNDAGGFTTISAYVAFFSLNIPSWDYTEARGTIVDNFFDSPFTNGSFSELTVNLVSTGTTRWIVERNINQTVKLSFPITNTQISSVAALLSSSDTIPNNFSSATVGISNFRSGSSTATSSYSYIQHKSNIFAFFASTVTTTRIGWQENISKYMPAGARLVEVKMGIRSFTDGYLDNDSFVVLVLNKYTDPDSYTNLDSIGAPLSSTNNFDGFGVTNNVNIATLPVPNPTGTQTYATLSGASINADAIAGITGYLDINTESINGGSDISDQFIANLQGYTGAPSFGITIDAYLLKGTGTFIQILFSPVMIKYRW